MSGRDWVLVDGVKYMRREDVIEECARVVLEFCEWSSKVTNDDVANIAAAIRALKEKHQAVSNKQNIKEVPVSNQWRCKLCGALTYGSQCDNCKHTPSDYPTR